MRHNSNTSVNLTRVHVHQVYHMHGAPIKGGYLDEMYISTSDGIETASDESMILNRSIWSISILTLVKANLAQRPSLRTNNKHETNSPQFEFAASTYK